MVAMADARGSTTYVLLEYCAGGSLRRLIGSSLYLPCISLYLPYLSLYLPHLSPKTRRYLPISP